MKRKKLMKIAGQKAVMEVMETYLETWQSLPALEKIYDRYVRNLKKIDTCLADLQVDLAPLKKKKRASKKELAEKVFPVTSVLDVYAADTGDKKLAKLSGVNLGELEKMKHNALVTYCIKVVKVSQALLGAEEQEGSKSRSLTVADYGLNKGHLENLQTALDACLSHEASYARTRRKRNKSKARLDRRIRENNRLLKNKLDRMMHLFRDTHPDFYGRYIKSRIPAEQVTPVKKAASTGAAAGSAPGTGRKEAPAGAEGASS